ncbi:MULTISPECIES: DUF503 domain-containing protein [Photobacterium]|uniref:DUF503 domain-containing protein n=1 Tax=Photobacterium TaxID=657 RepID=UPI00056925EE|nr:DUF503 domain-containing protein [Photobacterium marinum]
MSEQSFFITVLTVELVIPSAQSLKEKRREIQSLIQKIRHRFNASVAEVGYRDKWQRSVLAISLVGAEKKQLVRDTTCIRSLLLENANIEISDVFQDWL